MKRIRVTGAATSYTKIHHSDTLWMNRTENIVETEFRQTTRTTVDLMRHTKHLTVTLRQVDDPANIDCEDFDISVTDDNGCARHDSSIKENDELLTYTPHNTWTSEYSNGTQAGIRVPHMPT